jgi:hypothetical protein
MERMMLAGMVVGYTDYLTMPAQTWGDLILWKECEMERARRERERQG